VPPPHSQKDVKKTNSNKQNQFRSTKPALDLQPEAGYSKKKRSKDEFSQVDKPHLAYNYAQLEQR
jgi:hypothetical protein